MRTRRPTVDFEEIRRIANQVRIDTLNAIDELVIRTMSEGKDVEALSREDQCQCNGPKQDSDDDS